MALTEAEKERVRYHLGYLEVSAAASIQLGIPRPLQTVFLLEQGINNILEGAIPRVRRTLNVMDSIEDKLFEATDRLAAKSLDTLVLRDNEPDMLEKEYVRWGYRLADIFGVPIYAYSTRYRQHGGVAAGNIQVR